MSLPQPVECLASPDCCEGSPRFYGQGQTYLNAQTGFLLGCPPGFSCDAGFYPTVITVRKGEIAFTPPPGISPLRYTCCTGEVLIRFLPDGFTPAQFAAAAQSIVNEAASKLAGCKAQQYNQQYATPRRGCTITTAATLPDGNIGVPYSQVLSQTGLTGTVTWSLLGTLPPGLSLSSSGVISGTPTGTAASYGFTVRARNSAGQSCTKLFTLTVNACDVNTDWCADPGICRLRIKDFNIADWPSSAGCSTASIAAWDGKLSFIYDVLAPCKSYDGISSDGSTPSFALIYDPLVAGGTWQISYDTGEGTLFFANGPNDPSPLGIYINDGFGCTGPLIVEIEAYTP